MEFELGELFTHAARQVLPIAQARGLMCLADCEGAPQVAHADATALRHGLHDLFCAAIDALSAGFVFLAADLGGDHEDACRLVVHAAVAGTPTPGPVIDRALSNLHLAPEAASDIAGSTGRVAHGVCARSGAQLSFVHMPPEGMVFTMRLALPRGSLAPEDAPLAQGARAWLLGDEPRSAQLLGRRLQQLGWAVTTMGSALEAARQLATAHPLANRPALVIGLQCNSVSVAGLQRLRADLPDAQIVMGVDISAFGPAVAPGAADAVQVRAFPFSPGDLRAMTWQAVQSAGVTLPSGFTQPAPLAFSDRRRILVVDDNAVNLLVAAGMLQALGFEVVSAPDGEDAIRRCLARAPDAVLMDIQMPGLDGIETTRRLRRLQREGALAAFPIIAATAGDSNASRRHCLEAGMDAYLGKPLSLALIEAELRRILPLR